MLLVFAFAPFTPVKRELHRKGALDCSYLFVLLRCKVMDVLHGFVHEGGGIAATMRTMLPCIAQIGVQVDQSM